MNSAWTILSFCNLCFCEYGNWGFLAMGWDFGNPICLGIHNLDFCECGNWGLLEYSPGYKVFRHCTSEVDVLLVNWSSPS